MYRLLSWGEAYKELKQLTPESPGVYQPPDDIGSEEYYTRAIDITWSTISWPVRHCAKWLSRTMCTYFNAPTDFFSFVISYSVSYV